MCEYRGAHRTHAAVCAWLLDCCSTVLNVAWTFAIQLAPLTSAHGATKAFVLSLWEALWAECSGRGLRVIALCLGPVKRPFIDAAGANVRSNRVCQLLFEAYAGG